MDRSRDTRDRGTQDDRRDYNRDSHRDRDRRYRSRSRDRRDRDRDRDRHGDANRRRDEGRDRDGGGRGRRPDGRERDHRYSRGGGRGDDHRDRDREVERDRRRPTEGDRDKRLTRSRSPARDVAARAEERKSLTPLRVTAHDDVTRPKSRTATPPVAFKVGHGNVDIPNGSHKGPHGGSFKAKGQEAAAFGSEAMDTETPESNHAPKNAKGKKPTIEEEDDDDIVVEEDPDVAAMQAMLGIGGFGTTKQKKVPGNDQYAVRKEKKTEYRQYMNRVGGFNRPLSPTRE